jgi:cell division protein FtsI (penicillin-binding protein 3)
VAAPIVKTVIEDIIVSEGIPPSHPEEVTSKIPTLPDPQPTPTVSPSSQPSDTATPSPNTSPKPNPSRDRN